jgi:hypothetical protein
MSANRDELIELIKQCQDTIDLYEPLVLEAKQNIDILRKAASLLEEKGRGPKLPLTESVQPALHAKYAGLTMPDAIKKVLGESPLPLSTVDIANRLTDGGYTSGSSNLRRDVSVALNRLKKKEEIVSQKTDRGMVYKLKDESKGGNAI